MRFSILTLGCKINQYETQAMRESWSALGHIEASEISQAEIVVINSCAITARAVADVRQAVRRSRTLAPNARIIVTGCAAQVLTHELAAIPNVSLVVPQDRKGSLLADPEAKPERDLLSFGITRFSRARAILKVQDGCSHGCTYCIVPKARGRSRSRTLSEITVEALRLAASGIREIVLSGINLRLYGLDLPEAPDFWDLLLHLDSVLHSRFGTQVRLRISSLEPSDLHAKGLAALAKALLVCPQLHLSLQSGSPNILSRMNRGHYGPETVLAAVDQLRTIWPLFGLGADILVGFPGEKESDSDLTAKLCSQLPLSYAHVFPYSPRPGTAAARFPDQVPSREKKIRANRIRTIAAHKKTSFLSRLLQEPLLDLIVESDVTGRCQYYSECRTTSHLAPDLGTRILARPLAVESGRLLVKPIRPSELQPLNHHP